MNKHQLRRQARAVRKAIAPELRIEYTDQAIQRFLNFCAAHNRCAVSETILACYRAFGSELNLVELLSVWPGRIVLPCIEDGKPYLLFRRLPNVDADSSSWVPGPHGIMQPSRRQQLLQPELVLVPLLGFTRRGERIGQGQGWYDRTIANWRRLPDCPLVIGIAFSCQEFTELPIERHDQLLDIIITEKEVIDFGAYN